MARMSGFCNWLSLVRKPCYGIGTMAQNFKSNSEDETIQFARDMAPGMRPGTVLCLHGDLGAGKSTFARALIRALCDDPTLEVPSPTFTLVQTYEATTCPVWHFDLYRLKDPEDIWNIDWEDAQSGGNIVLVEWPDRLGPYRPADAMMLHFSRQGDQLTIDFEHSCGVLSG